MKFFSAIFFFFFAFSGFTQYESIGPLTSNPDIARNQMEHSMVKSNSTFDSTFIYISDTLQLPFLDEFSSNKFQQYTPDFTDPSLTFDKKYRLLDDQTSVPLPTGQYYSDQPTFRRVYDLVTSTFSDIPFAADTIKVGDLTSYPVVYESLLLYPPYYIYDTTGVTDISDTVWLTNPPFFQDSATQFFATLDDLNAYWLDDFAYHNYRFAKDPRTLGVATFDGLDENGFPYAIGTTVTNYADRLTSKPINLANFSDADSVYFSFLYQSEGLGDIPEAGDSLILEFYAEDLNQWFWIWSASGESVSTFKHGHIRVSDPKFFKKGFQFRFRNYGALSGMLDVFNVDYVYLRELSGFQDTLFKDFAFSYPVGSLIKTYTSVPWDHFKNNPIGKMNDQFNVVVYNGSNIMENNQNGLVEISYNGMPEGSFVLNAQTLSGGLINYGPNSTYSSFHDLSGGYVFDISKPGNHQSFDILTTASAQFPNLALNDSTFGNQVFFNYYSYDDGTAEAAYGPTGNQARLAINYETYEPDSLIGMSMHFVPSVNDVSNKLFTLTVWDDVNGSPGTILYEDNVFFPRQPIYSGARNGFVNYFFKDTLKVAVETKFYIGWRQFDAERLNIGLDRNTDNSEQVFYSINGGATWVQSSIPGSVMIRPIFSTAMDPELGIEDKISEPFVKIFPNPSNEWIKIETDFANWSGFSIYSLDGKEVMNSFEKELNVSMLQNGIYVVRIHGVNNVYKWMKI